MGEGLKSPHTVSLKVLRSVYSDVRQFTTNLISRLTRPSLAQQFPIPRSEAQSDTPFPVSASLAYPHASPAVPTDFILTPLLNLPESFQSAYVGETFSCTLSANNELPVGETVRSVSGVRVAAEIISPSNPSGTALDLETPTAEDEGATSKSGGSFTPGHSLQRILRLALQEEGEHTLAVTVTYTETAVGQGGRAAGGRVRTFRKLYQFVAANLVSVRTKAGDLDGGRYALEAQLENMGERAVVLDSVRMNPKAPYKAHSLNWDMDGAEPTRAPILNPRDIVQVAFLIEEDGTKTEAEQQAPGTNAPEKRFILGQLNIQWRGVMGDRGSISTGWLTGKKR
jgi:hypothetical protein